MAWEKIEWIDYGFHSPLQGFAWPVVIQKTIGKKARYKNGVNIEAEELSVFGDDGRFIFEDRSKRVFYLIRDEIIGADNGIETRLIRVEWGASAPGPVHGRPINEQNLRKELKKYNPAELQYLDQHL